MDFDRYMMRVSWSLVEGEQVRENLHYLTSQWSNYRCVQTHGALMRLTLGKPSQKWDTREPMSKYVWQRPSLWWRTAYNIDERLIRVTLSTETVCCPSTCCYASLTLPVLTMCSLHIGIIYVFFCSFLHLQFGNPHFFYNGSGKSVP